MAQPEHDDLRERRERWWRSAFLVLATIYVGLLLVGLLVRVLGGFTQIALILFVAWLLAFILSPVVAGLRARTGIPRGVAVGIVYAVTLLASGFLLFYAASALSENITEIADEFPLTRARIEGTLREWQDLIAVGRFDPQLVELYRDVEGFLVSTVDSVIGDVPEVSVAVLGALVLVTILSLYMLADSERIIARLKRIAPARYADEVDILERTISQAFGGFLRAQIILAAIQTFLTLAVVLLLELEYGFIITVTSALAMLVPFFGPPLALVPPIVATAIFASEWVLVVAPVLLVVQTVLVNYLLPRLMRDSVGIHPILVLVGLLVGAQVAGLWGALFGIPILAVGNVFFNYLVNLRTLEESPDVELDQAVEEVRRSHPDATPEELVAIAAEHAETSEEELRAAADDLEAADRLAEGESGRA